MTTSPPIDPEQQDMREVEVVVDREADDREAEDREAGEPVVSLIDREADEQDAAWSSVSGSLPTPTSLDERRQLHHHADESIASQGISSFADARGLGTFVQGVGVHALADDYDDDADDDLDDDLDDNGDSDESDGSGLMSTIPRLALVTPLTVRDQAVLSAQMDRLSLEQALLDVEVANARVLDLTARLVESNQRISSLVGDVDGLRSRAERVKVEAEVEIASAKEELASQQAHLDAQQVHLDAQKSSTAFRWASKVWNLRNALRS